jgi:hypothetical protein
MLDPSFEANLMKLQTAEYDSLRAMAKARREGDETAYYNAGLQLIANERSARAELKAEALRYAKELKVDQTKDDDAKTAQLLKAFARGCRLGRLWGDVMSKIPIGTRHVKKIYQIILPALDAMGRRADLAKLLHDSDPSVRGRAASLLKETVPDQCLPVLDEIYRKERFRDAGSIAMWALPDDALARIHAEHAEVAAERRRMLSADSA